MVLSSPKKPRQKKSRKHDIPDLLFDHTSGEGNAQIVIAIVRRVPVHVRAIAIQVTNIDEVPIRGAFLSLFPSVARDIRYLLRNQGCLVSICVHSIIL